MEFKFKLHDIGEGINEATIIKWLINEGDLVTDETPILEIQNDKSIAELYSPVFGKLISILKKEDDIVTVGEVLSIFEVDSLPILSEEHDEIELENPKIEEKETNIAKEEVSIDTKKETNNELFIICMPSVRKYAHKNKVNLIDVKGSGKNGRIIKEDIDNYINKPSKTENKEINKKTKQIITKEDKIEKMTPIRKAISDAMVNSVSNIPHVTIFDEVDASELVALRSKTNNFLSRDGIKLTYLPYIVKITQFVLEKFPILNSSVDQENYSIIYKGNKNIGIATDTEKGLFVPVIENVDEKSILEISGEIVENASSAKEGKLSPNKMRNGTFTISNIGSAGGLWVTPIINHPEVAILGLGRIEEKTVVIDGEVVIKPILSLSLSFDHRIIDGVTAQNAMNEYKILIKNISSLIAII